MKTGVLVERGGFRFFQKCGKVRIPGQRGTPTRKAIPSVLDIPAALKLLRMQHPSLFRDGNVSAAFVTLDDAGAVAESEPISLTNLIPVPA